MSKPRKLLAPQTLYDLDRMTDAGVPVAKAMRKLKIEDEVTRPTVVSLLEAYRKRNDYDCEHYNSTIYSLFPPWLVDDGPAVQEQPEEYVYNGYFPLGYWECKI